MRNKFATFVLGVLFAIIANTAHAKVTIEVLNPEEGKYLVTYLLTASKAHSTEYTFPSNGLISQDKKVEVVSITEKNTDQEFEYEVLPAEKDGAVVEGRYKVKAKFINPVPEGGNYIIEYKVILFNKSECYIDKDGRWLFRYATGHDAFFILPKEHAVVYANFPVLVYEKKGRTVLQAKAKKDNKGNTVLRTLIFKTMSFKK